MRINQNVMAFNAYRNLATTNTAMGKSLEKLSTGGYEDAEGALNLASMEWRSGLYAKATLGTNHPSPWSASSAIRTRQP